MAQTPPLGVQKQSSENSFVSKYSSVNLGLDWQVRAGLEFILSHFSSSYFPRTVSTKTTEGRQVLVNDKEEALARFKQANYLDCRINAYSGGDVKGDPNFIFIDIDDADQKTINRILNFRFKNIGGHPTVLFSGTGFHIYQPIESVCLDELGEFSNYSEPSRQFLKFAERYLSDQKCDRNHNPSFNSCLVRIPGSINSKNGRQVKIIQTWDRHRPSIAMLIGSFQLWLSTKQKKDATKFAKATNFKINESKSANSIRWIESLLKTPLDDYRKTIVNLVLAPYLSNIRQLQYQNAFEIIKKWLNECANCRKLDFNTHYLINNALVNAGKSGYKPMRLDTLKQRNLTIYERLNSIC